MDSEKVGSDGAASHVINNVLTDIIDNNKAWPGLLMGRQEMEGTCTTCSEHLNSGPFTKNQQPQAPISFILLFYWKKARFSSTMMQMKTIMMAGLIGLITSGVVAIPAAGAANGETTTLEAGYINFPPFAYEDQGESQGYLVELARRVFREMEQPVDFVQQPAARLYRQLESGETAFTLGAAPLHRLADNAIESSEPAITLTIAAYRRPDTDPVRSLEALKDQRVLLMQGYSYGQFSRFFEQHADQMTITTARTHQSALRMIQYERADYLINYQDAADATIEEYHLSGLEWDVIAQVDVHLYVSRALDNAQSLADKWDQHFRALRRNDQLPSPSNHSGVESR